MSARTSEIVGRLILLGVAAGSMTLAACSDDGASIDDDGASSVVDASGPGSSSPGSSASTTLPDGTSSTTSAGGTANADTDTGTSASTTGSDTRSSGSDSGTTSAVGTEPGSTTSGSLETSSVGGAESSTGSTGEPVLPEPGLPQFTDVTDDAGVWYDHGEALQAPHCLIDSIGVGLNGFCNPERIVAGAAVGDIDGDDDLDLFVTRTRGTNLLFRNDGGGFTEIAETSGLTEFGHGAGAAFGDIDNDGDADLFVATIASFAHLLYINDGTGHFTEDALARGAAIDTGVIHIGMTPTFADYDLDGYLDVYVGEWRVIAAIGDTPSNSRLLRNLGDVAPGSFEDVTLAAGVDADGVWALGNQIAPGTYTFSPAFVDLDDDRFPELTIASDFGTSRVYWNDGDGTFTDRTIEVGAGVDRNGMGSALGDYDNDGDMDWYVTSITTAPDPVDNRLYRNLAPQFFVEVAEATGAGDSGWGWGSVFFEADNDGDLDLLAVGGYYFGLHTQDPIKLWRNQGGGPMLDISEDVGFGPPRQRRAALAWDYDSDGDQDVFLTSNADAPELYRNDSGNEAGWLRVRVVGSTSNRDGLGARVYVTAQDGDKEQMREIGTGSHFMGHSERTAHFGLGAGDAPVASVRVFWPASETVQLFADVARNQTFVVEEP